MTQRELQVMLGMVSREIYNKPALAKARIKPAPKI